MFSSYTRFLSFSAHLESVHVTGQRLVLKFPSGQRQIRIEGGALEYAYAAAAYAVQTGDWSKVNSGDICYMYFINMMWSSCEKKQAIPLAKVRFQRKQEIKRQNKQSGNRRREVNYEVIVLTEEERRELITRVEEKREWKLVSRETPWNLKSLQRAYRNRADIRKICRQVLPINVQGHYVEKYLIDECDVTMFNEKRKQSRAEILALLQQGCVEVNPGPIHDINREWVRIHKLLSEARRKDKSINENDCIAYIRENWASLDFKSIMKNCKHIDRPRIRKLVRDSRVAVLEVAQQGLIKPGMRVEPIQEFESHDNCLCKKQKSCNICTRRRFSIQIAGPVSPLFCQCLEVHPQCIPHHRDQRTQRCHRQITQGYIEGGIYGTDLKLIAMSLGIVEIFGQGDHNTHSILKKQTPTLVLELQDYTYYHCDNGKTIKQLRLSDSDEGQDWGDNTPEKVARGSSQISSKSFTDMIKQKLSPIINFGFNKKKENKSEQQEKYDKDFPALGKTSQPLILMEEQAPKQRKTTSNQTEQQIETSEKPHKTRNNKYRAQSDIQVSNKNNSDDDQDEGRASIVSCTPKIEVKDSKTVLKDAGTKKVNEESSEESANNSNKKNRARSQIQIQKSDDSSGLNNTDRASNISCAAKVQTKTEIEQKGITDEQTRDFRRKDKPLNSGSSQTKGSEKLGKKTSQIISAKGKKDKKQSKVVAQTEKTDAGNPKQDGTMVQDPKDKNLDNQQQSPKEQLDKQNQEEKKTPESGEGQLEQNGIDLKQTERDLIQAISGTSRVARAMIWLQELRKKSKDNRSGWTDGFKVQNLVKEKEFELEFNHPTLEHGYQELTLQNGKGLKTTKPVLLKIYSNGTKLAYKIMEVATKNREFDEDFYHKDAKTLSQVFGSLSGDYLDANGETIDLNQIKTGDYVLYRGSKLVFQKMDPNPSRDNLNAQGLTKIYPRPALKGRKLADVRLNAPENQLTRPTVDEYRTHIRAIQYAHKDGSTPVMYAPMGWGKSTYFLLEFAAYTGRAIKITLPTVLLAQNVFKSLKQAAANLKLDNVVIGRKIQGIFQQGNIVVQTPAYLKPGELNFVDQFQAMSFHNLDVITSKKLWSNLVLMSATPFVPLIASAMRHNIKINYIQAGQLRTSPNFILWGTPKIKNLSNTPDNTIVFTTAHPGISDHNPTILGNGLQLSGQSKGLLVHPSLVFGANVERNYKVGIINFKRHMMEAFENFGYIEERCQMPIEYENLIQAMGRLNRHIDCSSLILCDEAVYTCVHRFMPEKIESVPMSHFNYFKDSFNNRSRCLIKDFSHNDSVNDLFVNLDQNKCVRINGKPVEVSNVIQGARSAFCFTKIGPTLIAAAFSKLDGKPKFETGRGKGIIDMTTRDNIRTNDLTNEVAGDFPLYNFVDQNISYFKVLETVKTKGLSINCLYDSLSSLHKAASFRSLGLMVSSYIKIHGYSTITGSRQKDLTVITDDLRQDSIKPTIDGLTYFIGDLKNKIPITDIIVTDKTVTSQGYVRVSLFYVQNVQWRIYQKNPSVQMSESLMKLLTRVLRTHRSEQYSDLLSGECISEKGQIENAHQMVLDYDRMDKAKLTRDLLTKQFYKKFLKDYTQGCFNMLLHGRYVPGEAMKRIVERCSQVHLRLLNKVPAQRLMTPNQFFMGMNPICNGSEFCNCAIYRLYNRQIELIIDFKLPEYVCKHALDLKEFPQHPPFESDQHGRIRVPRHLIENYPDKVLDHLEKYKVTHILYNEDGLIVKQTDPNDSTYTPYSKQTLSRTLGIVVDTEEIDDLISSQELIPRQNFVKGLKRGQLCYTIVRRLGTQTTGFKYILTNHLVCLCQACQYSDCDYELYRLGTGKCMKCYQHGDIDYSRYNFNLWDMLYDIYKIVKGGIENEQAVKSKLGLWLKTFIERNEEYPQIRKYIHEVPENIKLHELFNQKAMKDKFKPASVFSILLGNILSAIGMTLFALYKKITSSHTYESFIRRDLPCSQELYNQCQQPPNVTQRGRYILCELQSQQPVVYPNIHHNSQTKGIFVTGGIATVQESAGSREKPSPTIAESIDHVFQHQVREVQTKTMTLNLGETAIVDLGSRQTNFVAGPVLMLSNRYNESFRGSNPESRGMYCSYKPEEVDIYYDSAKQWLQTHQPKKLIARDAIHDPFSLQFALNVLKDKRSSLKAFSWAMKMPLVVPKEQKQYTMKEGVYSIAPSELPGWAWVRMKIKNERDFSELMPSHAQLERIARRKKLNLMISVIFSCSNLVACVATFTIGDNTPFTWNTSTMNYLGNTYYDQEGYSSARLDAGDKLVFQRSAECGKTRMLVGTSDLDETKYCTPRRIELTQERWIGSRIKDKLFKREFDVFERRSWKQSMRETFIGKLLIWFSKKINFHPTYNPPVQISTENCGLKYALVYSDYTKDGKFHSYAYGTKTTSFYPQCYHIQDDDRAHAVFKGEAGATLNEGTDLQVNGYSRKIYDELQRAKTVMQYEIIQFQIVSKEEDYYHIEGTASQMPRSMHISLNQYEEMLKKGWNKSIIPQYVYFLGNTRYDLPQIPTYNVFVQYCTCTVKKRDLLRVQDLGGGIEMQNGCTEVCPINQFYSTICRQGGARVSPDKEILQEFGEFTQWAIQDITDWMKEEQFQIDHSQDMKEVYFSHIQEGDKYKARKYRQEYNKSIPHKNVFDMFVKTDENHAIFHEGNNSTRSSLKPRLICCPSWTIRARIGLISFFTLGWFKKHFPEFFLAKSPKQMEQDLEVMEQYQQTYESDFSTYDATNGIYHRLAVDKNLFQNMYEKGIIKQNPVQSLHVEKQQDRYFTSNVKCQFSSSISGKGIKGAVYRAKGRLIGTTYSGHPTATTLGGTLRNLMYHLFSVYRDINTYTFSLQFQRSTKTVYRNRSGRRDQRPSFREFVQLVRTKIKFLLAGDDTGSLMKDIQDSRSIEQSMRRLCHRTQELITHGLGLVLKNPKRDFRRLGILSKKICFFQKKVTVLRLIPNTILTNSICSTSLTNDDAHFLAALSLQSYTMDPLTLKIQKLRLAMINGVVNYEKVQKNFFADRRYKCGVINQIGSQAAAFIHSMPVAQYEKLVDSISYDKQKGKLVMDISFLLNQKLESSHQYYYGLRSNLMQKVVAQQQVGMKREFQGPKTLQLIPMPKSERPLWWKMTTKQTLHQEYKGQIQSVLVNLEQKMQNTLDQLGPKN